MKIVTTLIYPPIPIRDFDYCAVDDDTYDGEGCPIGYGRTKEAAVADLMQQIEERN